MARMKPMVGSKHVSALEWIFHSKSMRFYLEAESSSLFNHLKTVEVTHVGNKRVKFLIAM